MPAHAPLDLDEETPTLAKVVREELRTKGGSKYGTDLRGDKLVPRSWASGQATLISGADAGTAEHTAVWTVLVAAGKAGAPVVGRPGSKVHLIDSVARAVGTSPIFSRHITALRLHRVMDDILGYDPIGRAPGRIVRLCHSLASTLKRTEDLPDPLMLAGDLTAAYHPAPEARSRLVAAWQSRAARTR